MNAVSGSGFDRQASLNAWRSALLNRGGLTPDDVDELQDHLEVTEDELKAQLAEEEAFWVAAHRLGTPEALTREFGKIQPNTGWLLRAQWLLLGLLAYWLLVPPVSVVVHGLVAVFASLPELRDAAAAISLMSGSIALLLTAGLVVVVVRSWRGSVQAATSD